MSGVLITKGSRLKIPTGGLVLTMSPDGSMTGELHPHVSYDMYPQWLRIAFEQAELCDEAALTVDELWTDGSRPEEIDALEAELRAGMQACVAAAAAIDGFYGTVKDRTTVPKALLTKWQDRKSPRYAQIAETLRAGFKIGPKSFTGMRAHLKTIFQFRDEAVHPTGAAREPVPHPRLKVATERRLAMFSSENALNAANSAMSLIRDLVNLPKPKHADLVEYCETAKALIEPVSASWEARRVRQSV